MCWKKNSLILAVSTLFIFFFGCVSYAAMGDIENVRYEGITRDMAGKEGSFQPDTEADPCFSVSVSGAGAITGFSITDKDGNIVWDSSPGASEWALVFTDTEGEVHNQGGSRSLVPFILGATFKLYPGNDGYFETKTREYIVEVRFIDGSAAKSNISVKAVKEVKQGLSLQEGETYAIMKGFVDRDLAGPDETLSPDGSDDVLVSVLVANKGTISSLEIRNISGRFSAWDTVPSNGRWSIVVTDDSGNILNGSDGSFNYVIKKSAKFNLHLADNGSIKAGDTEYKVVIGFSDGKVMEVPVGRDEPSRAPSGFKKAKEEKPSEALYYGKADGNLQGNPPKILEYENDYVSSGENLSMDGKPDWGTSFTFGFSGRVISFSIENEGGDFGVWDTLPGNGKWAIAVTDDFGKILNEKNGSVSIDVEPGTRLWLWIADNGSLAEGGSELLVTAMTDKGKTYPVKAAKKRSFKVSVKENVPEVSLAAQFKARYVEKSDTDRVGKYDSIKSDRNRDVKIRIFLDGLKGTINEIILKDSRELDMRWDTVPGNGRWAILVTAKDGEIHNSTDGSLFMHVEGKTLLHLWVADNGELSKGNVPFEVALRMNDGRVLSAPLER